MKLEDRLPSALDSIARTTPVPDVGQFDPGRVGARSVQRGDAQASGSRRLLLVAAVIAALGVGGLVLATNRSAPDEQAATDSTIPGVAATSASPTSPPFEASITRLDWLAPASATDLRTRQIDERELAGATAAGRYTAPSPQLDTGPIIAVDFTDDQGRSISYLATPGDGSNLDVHRLGFDSVSDITVRGGPGFIRTLDNRPDVVGLVWNEDGITYQLVGDQIPPAELIDLVEQLRPDDRSTSDESGSFTVQTASVNISSMLAALVLLAVLGVAGGVTVWLIRRRH